MENLNLILDKINSNSELDILNNLFDQLDACLKQDQTLREKTPENFFKILNKKLEFIFSNETVANDKTLELLRIVLKCIKNSAAAFKQEFSDSEDQLCNFLIEYLDKNLAPDPTLIINILQYFFNLIQGNNKAYNQKLNEWISLCFKTITKLDLNSIMIANLSSMILIYACLEKQANKSYLLEINKHKIDSNVYLNLTNILESNLDNNNQWLFKLIYYYFDHFYFNYLIKSNDFESILIKDRLVLIEILEKKLHKLIDMFRFENDLSPIENEDFYFGQKSLEFISQYFVFSTNKFLTLLENLEIDSNTLIDYLKEIKLLSNIICDLLTIEEKNLTINFIRKNLVLIQNNFYLFENTCKLFKEIHINKNYLNMINKFDKTDPIWDIFNSKSELVRLIGILVFENEQNQRYLVNDQLLHIISSNLNIDIDNPFVREWSIVALKHILSNLDFK